MMIRIYQEGTIRDLEFPASGTCRIGSSPKDDVQLSALKNTPSALKMKTAHSALPLRPRWKTTAARALWQRTRSM